MKTLIWKFWFIRHMQKRANCSFAFAWENACAWAMTNDIMKLADAFAEAFEAAECNGAKETIEARAALEAEIGRVVKVLEQALEPAVPQGWKLIKDSTLDGRSWPEDYKHENGNYQNLCCECGRMFNGYKRRVMCRVCSETPAAPDQWTDADSDAARLALELECLLLDTKDTAIVSKWWDSAHDALELHRQRLAAPIAPAQPARKHLHVGDSLFESWYSDYEPAGCGDKQRARDAYAAGMDDPLVAPAQQPLTDSKIDELAIEADSKSRLGEWNTYFARAIEAHIKGETK